MWQSPHGYWLPNRTGYDIDHHMSPASTCLSLPIEPFWFSVAYGATLEDDVPSLSENALCQWGGVRQAVFCLLHQATLWGLRTGKAFWRRWKEEKEQQGVAETCAQAWQQSNQPCMAYPERGIWTFFMLPADLLGPSLLLPVLGSNTAHRSQGLVGEGEKEACPRPGFFFFFFCVILFNQE